MSLQGIVVLVIVGLIAGWLAGVIWKGKGLGLAANIVIGIGGAFLGGFIFRLLGIGVHNLLGSIVAALAGALVLLFVISKIRR